MEHLSPLDAGFLEAEDSDPHISLAVGVVSIIAGPVPEFSEMLAALTDRAQDIPRFTQRLHTHPLDIESPEWVPDPHFDISHHVHRAALPEPGGDAELFALVAGLMEGRLDRERPLWQSWVIEGLSDDRWAVLVKVHHCIADGIATSETLGRLFDDGGPHTSFASDIRASKEPDAPMMPRFPRPSLNPLKWAGELWHVTTSAADALERAVVGAAELTVGVLAGAPNSSLVGPVSRMRRFSAARVEIADLEKVCGAYGVTLNDVALAAITGSYRSMLLDRGEAPSAGALRTLVPVSVRAMDDLGVTDNRVSAMLPLLPVDEPDPVARLTVVHERLARVKASGQREGASALLVAAQRIPFALSAWTIRLLTMFPQRSVTALATNVPGPRERQRVMGREVLEIIPVPPIALQLRTGIAMFSYADRFFFGIIADYDSAPDVDALAAGIESEVATLADLSGGRTKRRERSGHPPASAS
ncbi:WS/DGAT/MGAT family O-acyltransferase [Mycolicibacterium confluentis]|uniref:Diacylglycerol O-acyltransferase n=1 Tax=Mycolicibacterium confluentis TaxID=28047 RepID=A0A7I7XUU1_9MYCO|nr:wax ester/triacylglycerol synthase family O-acyltransferase [Mycolicibacterium confluentis]MCV7322291.1 wax ester/triacylglycerol synthase family O-acyltransferase [Mycolicibacterium confluentis]ORV28388.1 diacylglycerol O-acyltransferase [Mycolicibacterium confluentis]BBZ33025.1 diacylglycerol O-acyltransferase [Mycolicibacterium confluentis]